MSKWKEFFYYSTSDKIAIILLSILIVFTGGVSIYLHNFKIIDPKGLTEQETLSKEFKKFEDDMLDSQAFFSDSLEIAHTTKQRKTKTSHISKTKGGNIINFNKASKKQLIMIPGIGKYLAQRIVQYRDSLGGFYSLNQISEIKGISTKKLSNILPYAILEGTTHKIEINKVDSLRLNTHPYLRGYIAESIIKERSVGNISSPEDFKERILLSTNQLRQLLPYIDFSPYKK